ncbi:pyridoxamine 5'-phosphate oxidase family protein [Sandarakinorhabdus sp. DWP1-3-1]|uniref:pyridoxamine 5'-phosphate oxidase family protein n=1 Tax=Sandarakinorhabdus sp. DWP1-3-1 TaxID=2804627 RepID=UPI003CFB96B5
MSAIIRAEDDLIWFMTDEDSGKLDEIRADPRATVVFSDGKSARVVFTGNARISSERAMIEALWSPAAEAFYPAGPTDPDIRLIRFSPDLGELWESPGRVVSLFRMAAAVATGTSARGVGSHVKAPL